MPSSSCQVRKSTLFPRLLALRDQPCLSLPSSPCPFPSPSICSKCPESPGPQAGTLLHPSSVCDLGQRPLSPAGSSLICTMGLLSPHNTRCGKVLSKGKESPLCLVAPHLVRAGAEWRPPPHPEVLTPGAGICLVSDEGEGSRSARTKDTEIGVGSGESSEMGCSSAQYYGEIRGND